MGNFLLRAGQIIGAIVGMLVLGTGAPMTMVYGPLAGFVCLVIGLFICVLCMYDG